MAAATYRNLQVVISGTATPLGAALRTAEREVLQFQGKVALGNAQVSTSAKLARLSLLAVGAAAVAGLLGAVRAAVQLDQAMRNVNSISHLTEEQLKALTGQVIQLSTHTTQSASTLAKALYDVASSGFQGADGLKVTTAAATAATAGMTDAATAAKGILAVLNSYGLSADSAKQVSDALFQTVNLGVVTFGELSNQLGDVVGIAAAAHININDVGAAIAAMTLAGMSGAESTIALNRVITSILKPSDALASVLHSLGYATGEQALQAKGLYGVMEAVRQVTGGNVTALLKLFPEIRAARGAFALTAAAGENYKRTQEGIGDTAAVAGATQKAFNEQMKAAANQWHLLENRATAAGLALGQSVLPALIGIEHALNGLLVPLGLVLDLLAGTVRFLTQNAVGATLLGTVLASILIPALARLVIGLATASRWFVAFAGQAVIDGLIGIEGGINGVTAALFGLTAAETAATAGLAGLAAIGVVAFTQFESAGRKAKKVVDDINSSLAASSGSAKSFDDISKAYKTASDQLNDVIGKSYQHGGILQGLKGAYQVLTPHTDNTVINKNALNSKAYADNKAVIDQYQQVVANVDAASRAMGLNRDQIVQLANSLHVDLGGPQAEFIQNLQTGYEKTVLGSSGALGLKNATDDLGSSIATASNKADDLKKSLDLLLGVNLDADQAFDKYRGDLDALADALVNSKGRLDAYSQAGRDSKAALREAITGVFDYIQALQQQGATGPQLQQAYENQIAGLYATMQQAGYTKGAIDALLRSYGLVPSDVTTILSVAGLNQAQTGVDGLTASINNVPTSWTTNVAVAGADDAITTLNAVAQAAASIPSRKTMWLTTLQAKVEMGDLTPQAYHNIINDPDFRDAYQSVQGPVYTGPAIPSGGGGGGAPAPARAGQAGINSPASAGHAGGSGGGGASSAAKDAQEAADAAAQTAALKRQIARDTKLAAAVTSFDPLTVWQDLGQRLEQQAQAVAQGKADLSKNKYDTAADFYKKPQASLIQYKRTLDQEVRAQQQWKANLAKIAKEAGQEVADQLEAMGEQGVDLVAKMAAGTRTQVRAMAATLKQLGPAAKDAMADFQKALHLDVSGQAAFQANLIKLIQQGHPDIAAYFAGQGVDQAGDAAAAAVHATPAQLASVSKDIATGNATASGDDLKDLTSMIAKLTNSMGVMALSRATGIDVSRELGLYSRFKSVFDAGTKGRESTWLADIARINSGGQPAGATPGFAAGVIIPASQTGFHYRFAEPESGGEALIPLGQQHRPRAMSLYAATGRMLGVHGYAAGGMVAVSRTPVRAGGGGMSLSLGSNAISVSVSVAGTNATPHEIRGAVEAALTDAFDQLTVKITAGTGRNR